MPSTREGLLEAAAELMAERGIERVNTNQIARAAGVGVGTFYAQFPNKHDCHRALVLYALEELGRTMGPSRSDDSVAQEVRHWVETVVAFAEARPHLFRAAFGSEPRHASGTASVGASTRAVERRLDVLRAAGEIHPEVHPTVAAKGYSLMLNGLVCWWLDDRARAPRSDLIETLIRLHPAVGGVA